MAFPYMTQRIKRQPLAAILLFALNFVAALLLCILHTSSIRQNAQIDEVYENTTVTCQVSNLTGTQTDDLNLREWVIRLFMGNSSVPNSNDANYLADGTMELFRSYLSDVYAKVSIRGQYRGTTIHVVGITDIEADRALQEEYGCFVEWKEQYDDTIFSEAEAYCLIPKAMLSDLSETECIEITVQSKDQTVTKELQVVGTHTGPDNAIYCPWSIATQINQEIDGMIHADSISAVFLDSRTISDFWEEAASHYFVEPNAKGELTIWEESPVYNHFPYALLVNDDVLQETVSRLQNNLSIFRLCTTAIIVLSLILGLVIGHLIVRQRIKTLALQRILGQSNGYIFAETWLELTAITAVGIIAGMGASCVVGIRECPWGALAASLIFYVIGIASAIYSILRTDLIRSIKEDA